MMVTGWAVIDPLLTLLVSAVIVVGTWQMFTQALAMALQAVPPSIDMPQVQLFLNGLDGVQQVQDVHIWSVSTTETAITAHLVMPSGHPGDDFLHQLSEELLHQFNIHHSTFQIRLTGSASACAFSNDSH
jgi:cobalt-zinc-cadmium efflux system protein